MDWRQALHETALQLKASGIPDPSREAVYLLEWASGRPYQDWVLKGGGMPITLLERLRSGAQRRCLREPLAYIAGRQEFFGLPLTVTPAVLIPRPETEHLVEAVLESWGMEPRRVVDVGTGSGAVALALKSRRPSWSLFGVDISAEALAVASQNAWRLGLPVTWVRSNLLESVSQCFDIMAANLPYIDPLWSGAEPELAFEPPSALYAEEDGLAVIRQFIVQAGSRLESGGGLYLECGFDQAGRVAQELRARGFVEVQILRDYAGHDRVVSGRWK